MPILVADNFSAHKTTKVQEKLAEENIHTIFLPPRTTPFLQPLDFAVFKQVKKNLSTCFMNASTQSFIQARFGRSAEQEEAPEVDARLNLLAHVKCSLENIPASLVTDAFVQAWHLK